MTTDNAEQRKESEAACDAHPKESTKPTPVQTDSKPTPFDYRTISIPHFYQAEPGSLTLLPGHWVFFGSVTLGLLLLDMVIFWILLLGGAAFFHFCVYAKWTGLEKKAGRGNIKIAAIKGWSASE